MLNNNKLFALEISRLAFSKKTKVAPTEVSKFYLQMIIELEKLDIQRFNDLPKKDSFDNL